MVRPLRLLWIALIPLFVVVVALFTLSESSPTAAQARPTATAMPSSCLTELQKWVDPEVIPLGDSSQVTLVVSGTCAAWGGPIDLVLLADISNSMTKYKQGSLPTTIPTRPEPTSTGERPTPTPPTGNEPTPGSGAPEGEPPFCNPVRGNEPSPTPTRRPGWRPTPTPMPPVFSTPDINELEPAGDADRIRDVQKWIGDFLGDLNIERDMAADRLRVGLVAFDERVQVSVALSSERNKVSTGVNRLRGGSITRINTGMREAVRVLKGTGARPDPRTKVIIILSDFQFCAKDMRNLGVDKDTHVFTVGFGVRDYDRRKLSELASQGAYVSERGSMKPFLDAYTKQLAKGEPVSIASLLVRDVLTDTMQLDAGSITPPNVTVTGQQMEWKFEPPTLPVTLTYRVQPQAAGLWPVSVSAGIQYVDSRSAIGSGWFPPVEIEVLPPTATPTATPTASPTPTDTPTPLPTETPAPRAKYLPILFRNWPPEPTATPAPTKCVPEAQLLSVALAIDTSTSMSEKTPGQTQSKLEAAIEAAQEFVNQLKDVDRVAIVGFNNAAHVETSLTSDRGQIAAALRALPSRQAVGTRIDLGLRAAYDELTRSPQSGRVRAIVLLTDGRQIGDPNDVAAAARQARDAGITVVTIGLGGDVDSDLLRGIADLYYEAPGSEELLRIYREVARYIPCPGEP